MENINKLRKFYELKKIERANSVSCRKESSAEHSWSCLILADYFLSTMKTKLDRLRVYELLLYHDVVEIEAGDVCITEEEKRKKKQEMEQEAIHILKEKIPPAMKDKLVALFTEFEEMKTKEARFAKAIDALDAEIHELDYKQDWKGWTEEFLRKKKGPLFEEFPETKEMFEKIMAYLKEEGYFNQI
ncbi:HD domain-containing protein [Candidatus Woesearchaeota archaeon]|nr:HD domain-containing protein [Candidatus Woesearchaeota archaeon]